MFRLDPVELRVLGCLLEKQRTTPDTYPLTLNALRLACNQSTNRDPVVDFDEPQIQDALQRMHRRDLTRVASGHGSRASKYRHLMKETIGLADDESALLCVLLLRGAQTPGELKQRTERLHPFADLAAIDETLARLTERGLTERLGRRPGEKQVRHRHLLGDDAVEDAIAEPALPASAPVAVNDDSDLAREVAVLREEVAALRAEVALLREHAS